MKILISSKCVAIFHCHRVDVHTLPINDSSKVLMWHLHQRMNRIQLPTNIRAIPLEMRPINTMSHHSRMLASNSKEVLDKIESKSYLTQKLICLHNNYRRQRISSSHLLKSSSVLKKNIFFSIKPTTILNGGKPFNLLNRTLEKSTQH